MVTITSEQTTRDLIDRLKMQEESLIPVLMERGGITAAYAREVIRGAIAQLESQLYHIRQAEYHTELGKELHEETERLLRESAHLFEGKLPGVDSGVDWKWIVAIGLGALFLMGRSTKKPEASSLPE